MPIRCNHPPQGLKQAASFACIASLLALFAASSAHAQWDKASQLSSEGSVNGFALAGSGKLVHVVWGTGPIRYRRSTDQGTTWSNAVELSQGGSVYLEDPLAASGSDVYLIFVGDIGNVNDWLGARPVGELYMRRSSDEGKTWQAPVMLTSGARALRLSLAISGDTLHLAWMDLRIDGTAACDGVGCWDIRYLRSLDRGATWEDERELVRGVEAFGSERPIVRADGDAVHVAWMEGRDGLAPCSNGQNGTLASLTTCPTTYYKRSLDGGDTWEADMRLSKGTAWASRPNLALSAPDVVLACWDDNSDGNQGFEQYVRRSVNGGVTWQNQARLSSAPWDSTHGFALGVGSSMQVAWYDQRACGDPSCAEVYLRHSDDGGATWEAEENVSNASGQSVTPLLAATTDYTHVLWLDDRNGGLNVFHRRRALLGGNTGTDGGVPPPGADGGAGTNGSGGTSGTGTAGGDTGGSASGTGTNAEGDAGDDDGGALSSANRTIEGGGCGCRTTGQPRDLSWWLVPALILWARQPKRARVRNKGASTSAPTTKRR